MIFNLPSLPYNYDAMEPFLDKKTMEIHHTKHHQTYIDNVNNLLKNLSKFSNYTIEDLLKNIDQFSDDKKNILRNNAGGHANHSFFWTILKQNTSLHGKLKNSIEYNFGSIKSFKDLFEKAAITLFGSGWIWLIKNNEKLSIVSTANQDNPLMGEHISGVFGYPILGLDVWEHAYYLKYQNRRIEYIRAFWNIINWEEAENRYSNTNI